jgi:hypothetical protein
VAPLANLTIDFRPFRILGEKLLKVHRDAAAPEFAGRRFSTCARAHPSPPTGRKIVYFHNCGTEYYEPWEGEKVMQILEHNGFEVVVPKQDCCGLPLQSSGLFDDARKVVLRLARALVPYVRDDPNTLIVGNATSCTLMLKREAREILSLEHDPDLKLVSERTYDICELLLDLHDRGELKTDFKPVNEQHLLPRTVPAAGPLDRQARARAVRADPRPRGHRVERVVLRDRRHVWVEDREVRHHNGRRPGSVRVGGEIDALKRAPGCWSAAPAALRPPAIASREVADL